mgnify:CR=1 FL=1
MNRQRSDVVTDKSEAAVHGAFTLPSYLETCQ